MASSVQTIRLEAGHQRWPSFLRPEWDRKVRLVESCGLRDKYEYGLALPPWRCHQQLSEELHEVLRDIINTFVLDHVNDFFKECVQVYQRRRVLRYNRVEKDLRGRPIIDYLVRI